MDAKKGIGLFIIMLIGVLTAVVFLQAAANTVQNSVTTYNIGNLTLTLPATVNGTVALPNLQTLTTTTGYVVTNFTGGQTIAAVGSYIGTPGANLTLIQTNGQLYMLVNNSVWTSQKINVSGVMGTTGYISDPGTQSTTLLIVLFSAIAILAFVVAMLWRSDYFQKILNMGGSARDHNPLP